MVFQEQSVLPTLSAAENIFLGREEEFIRFGLISRSRMNAAAAEELRKVPLKIHPATACAGLSFADRQMVEIAKALSLDSRIKGDITILLDEPTSVLEKAEVELLFRIIRDLKQRASFVFISHRLEEVLDIANRIYVLRDGHSVAEVAARKTTITELHHHMVGRQLHAEYYREARQAIAQGETVLSCRDISRDGAFAGVSFDLHKGEVLGIAGVIGSGREDLARCLAGHAAVDSGTVSSNGKAVVFQTPSDATRCGIGLVPAERKVEGLVGQFSVAENMTLAALRDFVSGGVLRTARESNVAQNWIGKLGIKTPSPQTMASSLSGGNQQKVVLSKWRIAGVSVLILDHPTRGIDVGAKEDVYELIRDMTAEGLAIILLGDTLDEVLGLSSRVLVMRDGRVTAEFDCPAGRKPSQVELVTHMV